MFDEIAELIRTIWQADSDRRDSSRLGESGMDRVSRRIVGLICGTVIVLLIIASMVWWWVVGLGG